ncbi:ORF V: Enzymatic polyprotein [Labeo rohita]|uniref:ORF V: Enzymatic polyprotein n=1 Tax=Labeo rohita TaxID=84645 RepID=A0ABQ8LI91_LABRO|nr:ORF V: Enzymatic polyprotein [Labeo rohita]
MTATAESHSTDVTQDMTSAGGYGNFGTLNRLQCSNASKTGWGAVCNRQAASGSWTGPQLQWHINCLELLAVLLALRRFLPMLCDKHVLVRADNVPTVAYINRQSGLRSRRMSQLARHLLLWSQTRLRSLRAVHIPGELNRAADALSRQRSHPGEWRLHPQVVQLIWSRFGEAQVVLFASPGILPLLAVLRPDRGPPRQGRADTQLAPGLPQTLCKIREDEEQDLLVAPFLAHPDLVCRPYAPRNSPSLEDSPEEGPSFSGDRHNLAPASQPLEPPCVASGRDSADFTGLSQAVINSIIQARAPSTRQAYALKWGLFADWCSSRREDPQRCSVLSFLQEKLERRLSPSTLKVYVAAIAAYHDAVDGLSLEKHHLIVRFLRGARRLNPPRPHLIPSWDLSVVLLGLRRVPFEPLVSVELKYLSLKTSLLIALTSIKRVPKVPTTPFRDQVVSLQALPPEEADPALTLLCPVRALRTYMDRTRSFRCFELLLVCFGGQQMGNAVSKQRLAHWVVDAITLSYQCQADICRAAGWATPNTFARLYNLRVEPVSSCLFPYVNSGSSWSPQFRLGRSFLCPVGGSFTPPGRGLIFFPWDLHVPLPSIPVLPHDLLSLSPPPSVCFSHLAPLRTTEGERLGYICNPRSLKEGTETLRPLATILDCAGALGFGSAPQLKSDLFRGDWPPKGDPKYVSYDVTSPFPPSGNGGYRCNQDVS